MSTHRTLTLIMIYLYIRLSGYFFLGCNLYFRSTRCMYLMYPFTPCFTLKIMYHLASDVENAASCRHISHRLCSKYNILLNLHPLSEHKFVKQLVLVTYHSAQRSTAADFGAVILPRRFTPSFVCSWLWRRRQKTWHQVPGLPSKESLCRYDRLVRVYLSKSTWIVGWTLKRHLCMQCAL